MVQSTVSDTTRYKNEKKGYGSGKKIVSSYCYGFYWCCVALGGFTVGFVLRWDHRHEAWWWWWWKIFFVFLLLLTFCGDRLPCVPSDVFWGRDLIGAVFGTLSVSLKKPLIPRLCCVLGIWGRLIAGQKKDYFCWVCTAMPVCGTGNANRLLARLLQTYLLQRHNKESNGSCENRTHASCCD